MLKERLNIKIRKVVCLILATITYYLLVSLCLKVCRDFRNPLKDIPITSPIYVFGLIEKFLPIWLSLFIYGKLKVDLKTWNKFLKAYFWLASKLSENFFFRSPIIGIIIFVLAAIYTVVAVFLMIMLLSSE
jgi:hypothetical protein